MDFESELQVFNGLDYPVNNHSPCSRYTATGKLESALHPTCAALVAACQGPECPLAPFKAGICVSANLGIGQFDSHANNDRDQMKLIPEILAGIDCALERAEHLGIRVRPKHIHDALRGHAGIKRHEFSKRFPLKVPDTESLGGFWG